MRVKNPRQSFKRRCALSLSIAILLFIAGLCNLGVVREAYGEWGEPTANITAGQTPIRAQHFLELRNSIDNQRELCGLSPITWTDPSLICGQTPIRAIHMEEIRNALLDIYNKPPVRTPSFTFTGTASDFEGKAIKLAHFTEIRLAWEEMTFCGDGVCNGPEDTVNCAGDCLCNYGDWVNVDEDGECGVGTCASTDVRQIKIDSDETPGCDDLKRCATDYSACCNYSEWVNVGCGELPCTDNSNMAQTKIAEPLCPPFDPQCSPNHPLCCSYADEDSDLGCGLGGCNANKVLWGKAVVSGTNCPLDPNAECILDSELGIDCCQYPSEWEGHDCGDGDCGGDEMYFEKSPPNPDDEFCPVEKKCELSADCCDYSDPVLGNCGGLACSEGPNYVLETRTPAFPGVLCPPIENCRFDETYCCGGYTVPDAQTCGAWECDVNEMYYVSLPLDGESGCATHHTCVPDVLVCCGGYTTSTSAVCGTDGCDPDSRYRVDVANNSAAGCPELNTTCVLDEEGCCGGYTPSVGACGIGCTPDRKYVVSVPGTYATGCVDKGGACVAYSTECCGAYVTTYGECGAAAGCAANSRYQVDIANNTEAGCPDMNSDCVPNELFCCGGYDENYVDQACGEADCTEAEMYQIDFPGDHPTTDCLNKTKCDPRPWEGGCCTYGDEYANPEGCGLGDCDPGYRQWVALGSTDCANILTCELDATCNDCSVGATESCEISGCSGTKTCGTSGFYGACIQNPPECAVGAEQGCLNDQGVSSYRFCTSCLEWGDCSCDYGVKMACTTPSPDNCPGIRTCANNIWEDCQKIESCNPGATIACTTGGGLPGALVCNACGDAYSTDCLCTNGTTTPCAGGVRTCNSGVWSACVPN